MLRTSPLAVLFAAALFAQESPSKVTAPALPDPAPALSPAHFRAVRDQLRAAVGDGVILLRGGNKPADMLGFAQDQDFLYLSGVSEPGLALLLVPAQKEREAIDELLVPPFSRFEAQWNGEFLAPGDAAAKTTGFAVVGNVRALGERLDALLAKDKDGARPVLWTLLKPAAGPAATPGSAAEAAATMGKDPFDGRKSREAQFAEQLRAKYDGLVIKDLTPLLTRLRVQKASGEIALLAASAELAAQGHVEAMRSARVGMYEFQVAAIARYVFSLHGAGVDAYGAIVGAGKNGCVLHYMQNSGQLRDGDLVVMDYAATVHGYAADVTRTFPANGKFTPAQRKLVTDVWEIQQELLAMVKPGARLGTIGAKCADLLKERGYRSDHGPCHHVGLAVHDPYDGDELRPGMIITVEPGAYLRDQAMGCRIEDTVLVTEQGCKVLSAAAPSKPDDIERLMAERGIGDVPVGTAR